MESKTKGGGTSKTGQCMLSQESLSISRHASL